VTKEFDYLAEERIIDYFRREVAEPIRVLAEERGEVKTRPGAAVWTLIVDPVDGSENFARGSEWSSVSLALLPGEETPRPEAVSHALVANIFTGTVCEAVDGKGVWRDGAPVSPSAVREAAGAVIALDLKAPDDGAIALTCAILRAVKDARRFGSAAGEFAAVAYGGVDAYVDARGTLSPENYMAAYLIVRQAGGTITDRRGQPLAPVRSMTQGQSIVAAGTPELHAALLAVLRESGDMAV
jgi:myo-inositol-1(or 4)-monophosphatase